MTTKLTDKNRLSKTHKELLEEWDYQENEKIGLFPEKLHSGSKKKAFWICSSDPRHKWSSEIGSRTIAGNGCPTCSGQRTDETNCFATLFPVLLGEWCFEKNDVSPYEIGKNHPKKVWWVCPKNSEHVFSMAPKERTRKDKPQGCSICSGNRAHHTNCISTTHPHLIEEWDYEKNSIKPEQITHGSRKKIWWICKEKQHSFKDTPNHRTSGRGCPKCYNRISKGHQEVIDYISSIYSGSILINNRKILKNPKTNQGLELDVYLPEKKIAFEYTGKFWHSKETTRVRDRMKKILCKKENILLFHIYDEKWTKNKISYQKIIDKIFLE